MHAVHYVGKTHPESKRHVFSQQNSCENVNDGRKRSEEKRMFPGNRPAVDGQWGREVPAKSRPGKSEAASTGF